MTHLVAQSAIDAVGGAKVRDASAHRHACASQNQDVFAGRDQVTDVVQRVNMRQFMAWPLHEQRYDLEQPFVPVRLNVVEQLLRGLEARMQHLLHILQCLTAIQVHPVLPHICAGRARGIRFIVRNILVG